MFSDGSSLRGGDGVDDPGGPAPPAFGPLEAGPLADQDDEGMMRAARRVSRGTALKR